MRLKEFDILKGIGILLVVLGHTGISGLPYTYIYAFHMPLFFFVSGCFYKAYPFKEILKRRSKSLLLPWVSFATLFLLTNTAISYVESNDLTGSLSYNLMALDIVDEDSRSLFRTIWFLVSLFEISIIYALLDKLHLYGKWGGVMICWLSGNLLSSHIDLPLFFDTSLSCILYYHLGYEFIHSDYYKRDVVKILPWIIVLVLSAIIVYFRPLVNFSRNVYPWYLPFISVTYVVTLYSLIKQMMNKLPSFFTDLLTKLGRDSLIILGFHRFYFILLETIIPFLGIEWLSGLCLCTFKFLLVMPLVYLIKRPVEKFCPYFYGKTK